MENNEVLDLLERFYGEFSQFRKETQEEFKNINKRSMKKKLQGRKK